MLALSYKFKVVLFAFYLFANIYGMQYSAALISYKAISIFKKLNLQMALHIPNLTAHLRGTLRIFA